MMTTRSSLAVALEKVGFLFGVGEVHANDINDVKDLKTAIDRGQQVDIVTPDRKDYGAAKAGSPLACANPDQVKITRVSPNMYLAHIGQLGAKARTPAPV